MLESQATLAFHVNKFYNEQTVPRKMGVTQTVREVAKIVSCVLKEVEIQEPRFISSLNEADGRLEGLRVNSPTEFEVVLFLNQMGVFNFVDDGSIPGCAVLKLSDGRKRSMSLWVEFITASGYLSARKVRSRFQTLVAQAIEKSHYRDLVKLAQDTTEVRMIMRDNISVRVTPAFKCGGIWPRSAAHWPEPRSTWPSPSRVAEVKAEGFNLLSKDTPTGTGKNSTAESDAWVMSFANAEDRLVGGGSRRKSLSILKTLRDRHLDFTGSPLSNYHMKTLLLYESEKHPRDEEWTNECVGDRIQGILLQLVSCLRCRRLPHYFLPGVDLFASCTPGSLDMAARQVWCLAREIITNSKSFDHL
ncbi:putative nucleotidyltransferase MAB21L1 [Ciona intestinalis]|uniref:putative nucleotidyltransferase MAB21L1 n=1 Tax=Ciona intestinalis TaxID=7719 RepID=UPI00006A4665|nr:putative nucleotidyltransferase MAB21L1 [Ciona intestinalis]|eukprot:XP_002124757.1 putative nucleotidyltransferase MAB21L1 [Ciona intestinalis]